MTTCAMPGCDREARGRNRFDAGRIALTGRV